MNNVIASTKDGIMCKIEDELSTQAKLQNYFEVFIAEKFGEEGKVVYLNVTHGVRNWKHLEFKNREQILITVSRLLEYVNSERCNLPLS